MDPKILDWYFGSNVVGWLRSLGGVVADKNFHRYHLHNYTGGREGAHHARYTKAYADGRQKKG